jgi:DNA replication protein DnaC
MAETAPNPDTPTAVTLATAQQKLHERRLASEATKASSSSKDELIVLREEAICSQCGATFERAYVKLGERRLGGPTAVLCETCAPQSEGTAPQPRAMPQILVLLASSGVNVHEHGGCSFETYDASASTAPLAAAADFVRAVRDAASWEPVRGLYLVGDTGVGKTHLAVAIARALIVDLRPDQLIFDRASRLVTDLQDTYGSGKTGALLDRRERARVWLLDDLGSEKATEDAQRMLFDLINAREGKPTVITSNLTPKALGERWRDSDGWARIASRLSTYRAIAVRGPDRRFGVQK